MAKELGVAPYVLRFWETRLPEVKPARSHGGRRLYSPEQVALLRGIKALLHEDGMTIRGVHKALLRKGFESVAARGRGEAELTLADPQHAAGPPKDGPGGFSRQSG